MTTTDQRDYRGLSATARRSARRDMLLAAGLELIGTQGLGGLTVRAAIAHARLSQRYFYESFASTDALAVAVYEQIAQELTRIGLAAIADPDRTLRERVRAGLDAVARFLTDDPRKGRVLLVESAASPVLAPQRHRATAAVAELLSVQAGIGLADDPADRARIAITARFLVGGFAESVATLIQDVDHHDRDAVVDRCTDLFLSAYDTAPSRRR